MAAQESWKNTGRLAGIAIVRGERSRDAEGDLHWHLNLGVVRQPCKLEPCSLEAGKTRGILVSCGTTRFWGEPRSFGSPFTT